MTRLTTGGDSILTYNTFSTLALHRLYLRLVQRPYSTRGTSTESVSQRFGVSVVVPYCWPETIQSLNHFRLERLCSRTPRSQRSSHTHLWLSIRAVLERQHKPWSPDGP